MRIRFYLMAYAQAVLKKVNNAKKAIHKTEDYYEFKRYKNRS